MSNDRFDKIKAAEQKKIMAQLADEKKQFIRQIKNGLGEQMINEITMYKKPSRMRVFWNKIQRVLGL